MKKGANCLILLGIFASTCAVAEPSELVRALAELQAPDLELRQDAAARLVEAGPEGVDLLLDRVGAAAVEEKVLLLTALAGASASGRVLEALSTALRDSDERIRAAAVEAAAGMDGAAGPLGEALHKALADPATEVRLFAALALARRVDPRQVPLLLPLLTDPETEVRLAAAEALTAHGRYAMDAVEALRTRLRQDEALEVRAQAARALGRIGSTAPTLLQALAEASLERDAGVRRAAREALGLLGPPAASTISALISGLSDPEEEEARAAAAWALGRMGKAAGPAVAGLLNAALLEQTRVADEAITALARIGDGPAIGVLCDNPATRRAMLDALAEWPPTPLPDAVLTALADWVPDNRYAAMRVVAPLAHPAALQVFLARLEDTEARERVLAAEALVPYSARAASAVPALVRLLDDEAPGVAEAAAQALLAIGGPATPAVQAAFESRRKNPGGRPWAALVLGVLGGARAADALRQARHSPDDALRVAAAAALYGLDSKDEESLDSLMGALTGPSGEARRQAALAVGRLGPRARPALPALIAALDAPEQAARLEVVRALAAFSESIARRALRRALNDHDESVRVVAAEALGRRREDAIAAVPALAALLHHDDTRAGMVAARVLAGLGPAARDAVPALIEVDDRDRERLVAAHDALRAIAGEPAVPVPGEPTIGGR